MMTSLLSDNDNGRALNASHITMTVDGIRKGIPSGWVRRYPVPVRTAYGHRIDYIYEYPDGTKVQR